MKIIKKEVFADGDEFNLTDGDVVHSEMKTLFDKDYLIVWFVKWIDDVEEG